MDYKLSFTYEIQGDVDFEDLNQIDQEKVLTEGIRDFENHLSREVPIFYSNDYEFDIKNQKIYIYIYTETELSNDTLDELVFGDKGYWETTSRQTIYYGEVVDNDYYEMPYEDSYEATLSLIISDAKVEELEKSLNEVYPIKGESKSDFINRFMRVTAKEYPDVKQRYAVAYSYWDRRDKKKLKEDTESLDIIEAIKERFVIDDYPVSGPSFLLPDGSFVDISSSFDPINGYEDYPAHREVEDFLEDIGLSKAYRETSGSPTLQSLGAIRLNDLDDNNYIELSKVKPTFEQYENLEKWVDENSQEHSTLEVATSDYNKYKRYDYAEILPEEIIKRIKRYYSSGQLYENKDIKEAYLDPEEEFWDYRTSEVENEEIFDETRSESGYGQWYIDNLNKEYKGKISHIEYLTPREYFEKCAEGFKSSFESQIKQIRADKETLDHLKEVITKYNKKFPITYLDYSGNDFRQEGRHRMYVAGELIDWDKKFPVLIIKDADKTLNLNIRRNRPSISHRLERYVLEDETRGAILYGNSAYDMLINLQNIEDSLDKDTFNTLWDFIYDYKESFK